MKHSPLTGCSTYIFVIVVMLVSFVLISTAVAVSAPARRTSANYGRFASLYDIGLSACERMKLLLYEELEDNKDSFSEELAQRLKYVNYENDLNFEEGRFILGNDHLNIFREVREKIVQDFLDRDFTPINAPREYSFRYNINSSTGVYNIHVNAEIRCVDIRCSIRACTNPSHRGVNVRANVGKHNGNFSSMPLNIFGRIEWRRRAVVQAELIPLSYEWRDGPPDWFKNAQSPHQTISLDISGLESEAAIHIVSESVEADGIYLNVDMFNGEPTMVINPHNHPLYLYGDNFRGIIIAKSDIFINTLGAEGSIISGGEIFGSGVTTSPDILFEIETDEVARRILYDMLGITNFAALGRREATAVLKDIEIKDFEIEPVNLFEPVLVGVQQV